MDEASKLLMAFTVGLLGYYEWLYVFWTGECQLHSRGWWIHVWVTFNSTGVSSISMTSLYFWKHQKDYLVLLRTVFQKLKEAGLKLKPRKCEFFKKSLTYLGHKILERGIKTDYRKIKVIWERPTPKTVTEVRRFLGFTNYYQQFIYKYAQVTQPLYHLILGGGCI